jgi:hydroxymethylglutaryl-CoA lyase
LVDLKVTVHEVGPRDGLQNETVILSTEAKLAFIERLVASGLTDIEVTSFVKPRWVPQLADAMELVRRLPPAPGVTWWALVPNRIGMERALEAGIPGVATFMSTSETHNKKNINRTIRESLASQREVIATAAAEGLRVRSYLSTVFGCPYEGDVSPERVLELSLALLESGAERISLGDTTGMANPSQVRELLNFIALGGVPLERVALHMHDTRGAALANVIAGLDCGVRVFDASVAGLGGCPYAPGASGNLATEDLVHVLEAMGWDTSAELEGVAIAGAYVAELLGKALPGRYHRYFLGTCEKQNAQNAS